MTTDGASKARRRYAAPVLLVIWRYSCGQDEKNFKFSCPRGAKQEEKNALLLKWPTGGVPLGYLLATFKKILAMKLNSRVRSAI